MIDEWTLIDVDLQSVPMYMTAEEVMVDDITVQGYSKWQLS